MNLLNKTNLSRLGLLGLIAINAYIIFHFFFPLQLFYYSDDWFVLPEIVWMPSKWAWVEHLMFLNQSRITLTGDFMLYRPGLFFIYGVTDVFFRTDRMAQQYILMGIIATALLMQYVFLKQYLNKLLAATLCMYILCIPAGYVIFHWFHLVPYVLALGFLSLGLKNYLHGSQAKHYYWAGLCFWAATLFHELAIVTLIAYFAYQLLFSDRSKKHLLPLSLPLVAFFTMATSIAANSSLPIFFDKQNNEIIINEALFNRLINGSINIFTDLFYLILPFGRLEQEAKWPVALLSLFILLLGLWQLRKDRDPKIIKPVIPLAIALCGIIAGVLVGRVAPRGVFSHYYLVLMLYFLLPIIALCYHRILKQNQNLYYAVIAIITISNLSYAEVRRVLMAKQPRRVEQQIHLVSQVSESLKQQPDHCFAGSFSAPIDSETSYLLNIAFWDRSCKDGDGKTPLNFIYNYNDLSLAEQLKPVFETRNPQYAIINNSRQSTALNPLFPTFGFNIVQAKQRIPNPEHVIISDFISDTGTSPGFEFEIESKDSYPILYNFGFEISSVNSNSVFILFQNNYAIVASREYVGKTSLNIMKDKLKIRIFRDGGFLFVMDSNQVLLQFREGFKDQSQIRFINFENGTPFEKVVKYSELSSKLVSQGNPGALQFFTTEPKLAR